MSAPKLDGPGGRVLYVCARACLHPDLARRAHLLAVPDVHQELLRTLTRKTLTVILFTCSFELFDEINKKKVLCSIVHAITSALPSPALLGLKPRGNIHIAGGEAPRRQPIKFGDFVSLPGIDLLKKTGESGSWRAKRSTSVEVGTATSYLPLLYFCRQHRQLPQLPRLPRRPRRHGSSLFLTRKLAGLSRRWLERQGGMAISTGEIDVEDPTSRVRDTTYK